ncbi:VPS33 protein, partial [Haematococcus lacustris]
MNVVHIERLDGPDPKENHPELKAVAFIRPTRDNVTLLKRELKAPRFQSLSLSFTNLELFGDFCVIDSHHFMIPCHRNDILLAPSTAASSTAIIQAEMLDRMVQGLSALFLAVRRRPIIRYQRNSEQASRLADSLYNLTYKQQYQLFDFGARGTPVLLILDRRDDPVTPLLTQWSYQAMIHELIGINDNTVKLTSPK